MTMTTIFSMTQKALALSVIGLISSMAMANDIEPCHNYELTLPAGLEYASASECQVSNGLVAVKDKKEKYGYINTKSELVIAPQFDRGWDFAEGLAVVKKGDKHGYIKPNGSFAIQPTYDDAWDFQGGLAAVQMGEKYGYINKDGKIAIGIDYDDTYTYFNEGFALVMKNKRWGMIDHKGKVIAPLKYDELDGVGNGRILARLGEKYGYLDYKGKVAIGFHYEHATAFKNGIAEVLKIGDDDYTHINRLGKPITKKIQFD